MRNMRGIQLTIGTVKCNKFQLPSISEHYIELLWSFNTLVIALKIPNLQNYDTQYFFSGSVISDTMKFAFLFFEFFIPYTVGFWILFGNKENSTVDWKKFNDLTYSVWSVSRATNKITATYCEPNNDVM